VKLNENGLKTKLSKIVAEHCFRTEQKCMVPICLYCLSSTKSGQLILRKITKIVAIRF